MFLSQCVLALSLGSFAVASSAPSLPALPLLGEIEKIQLDLETASGTVTVQDTARIDTGATQTSIDGIDVKKIDIGGKPYVTFKTRVKGVTYNAQAPFVMEKRVRSSDGVSQLRSFVRLNICVGSTLIPTVVSLTDRSKLRESTLVGRTLLKDRYLVDVRTKFEAGDPDCE